ncbi:MAG: lmo0937 family membrane protein [Bacteroidota bacterium]
MGNFLYTIALILAFIWAIGYIGYDAGGIIHFLLILAALAVILRLIRGKSI